MVQARMQEPMVVALDVSRENVEGDHTRVTGISQVSIDPSTTVLRMVLDRVVVAGVNVVTTWTAGSVSVFLEELPGDPEARWR